MGIAYKLLQFVWSPISNGMKDNRSFFERLTGSVRMDDMPDTEETISKLPKKTSENGGDWPASDEEGQLTIDVYQTPTEIIIKTMVAGVKPDDLDVMINRDSITIRGKRNEDRTVSGEDYFNRELYWGSFSRTIQLPEEIDIDSAEATEKYGMLILTLPKLDKNRQTKLRVKG